MARRPRPRIVTDPIDSAKAAGLRYVTDQLPGITRRRAGRGFVYSDPSGKRISNGQLLERIRRLAIPPAWTDVWICPFEHGHLQAVGRDARGRKQYRYHERWRAFRDETKYTRMLAFAEALPRIRARVDEDLRRPDLSRERVLATVVRLLETTLIRVGNGEYARENGSFGLTTMRTDHVDVAGARLRFRFRGKAGREQEVGVRDPRLARVLRRLQDLPGQELFRYVDDAGAVRSVDSTDVNAYLRDISGSDFTAKDFRTWTGTVLAALALAKLGAADGVTAARGHVKTAIASVAGLLGNTAAIARKCYVHPAVIDCYIRGAVLDLADRGTGTDGLKPEEAAVIALLDGPARRIAEAA
jgi:DNA topoisomerase-1